MSIRHSFCVVRFVSVPCTLCKLVFVSLSSTFVSKKLLLFLHSIINSTMLNTIILYTRNIHLLNSLGLLIVILKVCKRTMLLIKSQSSPSSLFESYIPFELVAVVCFLNISVRMIRNSVDFFQLFLVFDVSQLSKSTFILLLHVL